MLDGEHVFASGVANGRPVNRGSFAIASLSVFGLR
jgi:hypothetical protein